MYKKRHQEKLSFRDIITLMKMSMRGWIWRHEGDSFVQNLRQVNSLAWMWIWYVILALGFTIPVAIIGAIPSLIAALFKGKLFSMLSGYITMVLIELVIFDPKKVKRSIRFTRSAWWNNTGIQPTEIEADPGTYGEYAATMRIEEEIEKSGRFGKIYNSVLIPVTNHGAETYAESDIVVVTEDSIQLFEVKNHTGRITGSFRYEADTWYRNEEYDLENKYGNPLRQNQHHVNYLIEYLYPRLSEKGLLSGTNPFFCCFVNAVMYTVNRYCSVELDFSEMPIQTGCFFTSGPMEEAGYTLDVAEGLARFSPGRAAADEICRILDGLTDMDPYRHRALVGNKVMTDLEIANTPGYGAKYSAVVGRLVGQMIPAIERSNDGHLWYDIRRDHMFWAAPEFEVTYRSEQKNGEAGYQAALEQVRPQEE